MRNFWATPQNGAKKPDGANRPVRCVVFMGSFRRVATVARPSLHRPCCAASAGPGSMPFPLPLSVAPHPPGRGACRFRFPSPLPLSVAPPGCVVPVVAPLRAPRSGWRSRRFRAPSLLHWVAPFVLPLSRRVAPPGRAAALIAWRPAPDRSAGPRCRAPCGRCPPRSPTR